MSTQTTNHSVNTMMTALRSKGRLIIQHFDRKKIEEYGWNTRDSLGKAKYYTCASLLADDGTTELKDDAVCSKRDTPIRKRGLEIAIARLYKQARKRGIL